jgi:hypothetical protein
LYAKPRPNRPPESGVPCKIGQNSTFTPLPPAPGFSYSWSIINSFIINKIVNYSVKQTVNFDNRKMTLFGAKRGFLMTLNGKHPVFTSISASAQSGTMAIHSASLPARAKQ